MANYPIKLMKDEQGTPFVPLVSMDAVVDSTGKTFAETIDRKLEADNIKAGNNVILDVEGNDITIDMKLPDSLNIINNITTAEPGKGSLDAYQGKVLSEMIPQVINNTTTVDTINALSAYQGYLLGKKVVPEGGDAGQVLKKAGNGDHELEWGDAADPNAIVGDGSIMKIVELSYAEYKQLEKDKLLRDDTEYHISDLGIAPNIEIPGGGTIVTDPDAISGDGTIKKIIEIPYREYLALEDAGVLDPTTEYHISDWNENERTYLTTQEIEEIIYDKTANHTTENQVNSMIEASVINNLTTDNTTKSLSAAQGKILNDKITEKRKVMRLTRSKEIQWSGTTDPARMPYDVIAYDSSNGCLGKSRDGSIRIGAGVHQIRVSGQIPTDVGTPNDTLYLFVYLYLNDICVFKTIRPNLRWDVLGIYDVILDVQEGDVVDLYISSNNSGKILLCAGNDFQNFGPGPIGYLQVEVLA